MITFKRLLTTSNNEKLNIGEEVPHNLGGFSDTEFGWEKEANAVIQDVHNHVKLICVADKIKVSL